MLKYTMLHTTGYQKLLYGKENITPYLKYNNQYVPSLRLSMAECSLLPGPGGNAEEQLLKTDSRPTVGRQSTELAHYQLSSSIVRLLADGLRSVGHGKLWVTCR